MLTVAAPVIRTEEDYREALEQFDAVFGAPEGHPDHGLYLVLADLIEAYENRQHPIPILSGRALLASCMRASEVSQSQLPEVGPQSVVSAVLSGKRSINARMALALAKRFLVPADAFLA